MALGPACAAAGSALFETSRPSAGDAFGGVGMTPVVTLSIAVTTILLIPVAEEILFRRLIHGRLGQRFSVLVAVVVTGVLFGLSHVAPAIMLYVLPWGPAVTAIRAWHDTVRPACSRTSSTTPSWSAGR